METKSMWRHFATAIQAELGKVQVIPTIPEQLEQARKDWTDAQGYYNSVYDTDLVDHAVYMMQAAEKKYIYLLKMAKREGVTCSPAISQTDGNKISLMMDSYS